jgi:putative NADPH-quinone reductase
MCNIWAWQTSLLKQMKESEELQRISFLMTDHEATVEQIGKAGITVIRYPIWWQSK